MVAPEVAHDIETVCSPVYVPSAREKAGISTVSPVAVVPVMVIDPIPAPWVLPAEVALVQVKTNFADVMPAVGLNSISLSLERPVDVAFAVPTDEPFIDTSIVAFWPERFP